MGDALWATASDIPTDYKIYLADAQTGQVGFSGLMKENGNLALIYRKRGDLEKAEEMHEKSLEIAEKLGLLGGMARDYANLGSLYEERGDIEKARAIKCSAQEMGEWLAKLNQQVLWCGSWVRDGDTVTSVCEKCGCPLVRAGLVKLSPTFCNCSRGWIKAVFETVSGRPVEVELKQAISRGDPVCEFVVHL